MNVLMLSTNLDRPEAHLINGLAEKGLAITLMLSQESPFLDQLNQEKIDLRFWNFTSRLDLKSIREIKRILAVKSYDIIHTFNARALSSALVASLFDRQAHVTYRGTTGHLSRLDPSSWLGYLNPKLTAIICVSDAVKDYLVSKGISREKLVRIYKGHDLSWYQKNEALSRHDLGISDDQFLVGCSANMRRVKGVDLLLKAFRLLPDELPIRLLLIGELRDAYLSELLKDPALSARVTLLGFRKDAASILRLCNAFCMPSRKREGLPKALIEAMIQGVAPIVTDVGGMPELVHDRIHGLVVPEENEQAIADAILELYGDPALTARLRQKAAHRIQQDFHISQTISQTCELYRRLRPGVA